MPPSAFLSWVQETTFAGVPLWSLLIAVLAGSASFINATLVVRRGEEATATLASRFSDAGKMTINVLGTEVAAQRIDESVVADRKK